MMFMVFAYQCDCIPTAQLHAATVSAGASPLMCLAIVSRSVARHGRVPRVDHMHGGGGELVRDEIKTFTMHLNLLC
jgi:hypothetical protein